MKEIILSDNSVAFVDDEDFPLLNRIRWRPIIKSGVPKYATSHWGLMHRLIIGCGPHQIIDHLDINGLNNQKENLRIATPSQNNQNRKKRSGTSSQFIGVCWHKTKKKWISRVTFQNREFALGAFDTEVEAALAYNKKASEIFGKFTRLNQIKQSPQTSWR